MQAWRGRDILCATFGFVLMTAFVPGISGVATLGRWDCAAMLAVAWFFLGRGEATRAGKIGMVLLAWLAITLIWSASALDGVDTLWKLSLAGIAFAVGMRIDDAAPLLVGSAVGLAISSAVALAQAAGFYGIGSLGDEPAGLFYNRDRLAAAAALVLLGLIALRHWRLIPALLPSLAMPMSRAAFLAVALGLLAALRRPLIEKTLLAFAVIAAVLWLRGFDLAASERVWIWQDTLAGVTLFGHGLGSFREVYPAYLSAFAQSFAGGAPVTRPEHPHNELLWLLFEGGIPALLLAAGFCHACYHQTHHPLRIVLVGLFVLCQFAMPLHDPATLILGALLAGYLAGPDRLLRAYPDAGGIDPCARLAAGRRQDIRDGAR